MTAMTEPTAIAADDPGRVPQLDAQHVGEHGECRAGRSEQIRAPRGAGIAEALEGEDEQHGRDDVADA